jgi:hypothetical protein
MLTMFSRRSRLTQVGATALPLILFWAFVACLALCSDHAAEAHDDSAQLTLQSMSESHDAEDCPIPSSSFLLPARQSDVSTPQVNGAIHETCHVTGATPRTTNQLPHLAVLLNLPSTSDPPLIGLGSLRL